MTQLEEKKQANKAGQYQNFGILLVVALTLSALILLVQGGAEATRYVDDYFKWWWAWDAYWQFVYFACVLSVAMIWRPSAHNASYGYSNQIPVEDDSHPVDEGDDDLATAKSDETQDDRNIQLEVTESESFSQ